MSIPIYPLVQFIGERKSKFRKEMLAFDAHMHIGKAYQSPKKGDWVTYIKNAKKNGIRGCIVIPPCIPDWRKNTIGEEIVDFLVLRTDSSKVKYIRKTKCNNSIRTEIVQEDPFVNINKKLLRFTIKSNTDDFKVGFAPLVHPLFFDFHSFSEEEWNIIKAIKIHPGSFGINHLDVSREFLKKVEQYNKPLILHTGYKNSIGWDWLNVVKDYNIKVLFTHGVRLDKRSAAIIREDCRYYVGIAPYKRLALMNNFTPTDDFLYTISRLFPSDSIVFDTDYPENYMPEDSTFYWDFLRDLNKYWSTSELKAILYYNSMRLFDL